MGLRDRLRDEGGSRRRRLLLLLLVLFLVVVGAGIGGLGPSLGPQDDPSLSIDTTPAPTTTSPPVSTSPTPSATANGTQRSPSATSPESTATPTVGTATQPPSSTTPTTTVAPPTAVPTPTPGGTTRPTPPESSTTTAPPTTTPPEDNALDLTIEGESLIFDYAGVAPGKGGTETLSLSNHGSATGTLSVANISAVDEENGIVGGESAVDDSPGSGELADHLRLAIEITYPSGRTVSLFGTGDGPRPVDELAAIDGRSASERLEPGETATVAVRWVLPESTGNIVQSDAVSVDVTFALRSAE